MEYDALQTDNEIHNIVLKELKRQQTQLTMIPSENYCSKAVLEASGSILTNKYAEGYPNKRYYQGNEFIDQIELVAIERAKELFGAEHANVQTNSGSPANMAVYFALLEQGDKILAMNLNHGGHLTHGSPVNFSGKQYTFIDYGVDEKTQLLDYEAIRALAIKEQPKLIVAGFTAYPRLVDFEKMSAIAKEVNAYLMADISHIAGLIAGKVHPSPFPHADVVTTTTHKTLRGPRSAIIMCKEEYAKKINKAVFPGLQGGPHEHIIAAKAVAFKEAMKPEFKTYAEQIIKNAKVLATTLQEEKISLVSNGTDTHLLLIDLIKTLGEQGLGKPVAQALEAAGIITNANTVPFDPSTPFKPSGVRLGTPALTTQGMKEEEMKKIGKWMAEVIHHHEDEAILARIKEEVKQLCESFPLYA